MSYAPSALTRAEVDALSGPTLLEFGVNWCGHCQAAQPLIASALAGKTVRHLKVEDGKGRPLGRSFQVKQWPTLIFLSEGKEVARRVRPSSKGEILDALAAITA